MTVNELRDELERLEEPHDGLNQRQMSDKLRQLRKYFGDMADTAVKTSSVVYRDPGIMTANELRAELHRLEEPYDGLNQRQMADKLRQLRKDFE